MKVPRAKSLSLSVDKAFLYCIVGGAYLSKSDVLPGFLPGVSIGDILLGCGSCFILICFFMTKFEFISHRGLFYLFLFWICALSSALFFFITAPLYFTQIECAKSLLKLGFYVLCTFVLIYYLHKVSNEVISSAILNIALLHGLIAIYIVIILTFEINFPYKFFWYGQPETYISNSYYRDWGVVVARGTLSEASVFGIAQNLCLAFLYFLSPSDFKIRTWKHATVIISIALTLSFTAFFLLTLNLALKLLFWLLKYKRPHPRYKWLRLRSAIILPIIILVIYFMTPITGHIDSAILKRVPKVLSGEDDSASARLLGSWEVPLEIMNDLPIFGVGLGNIEEASLIANYEWEHSRPGGHAHNMFSYVLGTMGIIGFGIFILFIADLIFWNQYVGIVFLASMFATGALLEPTFWIFYCLFTYNKLNKKASTKEGLFNALSKIIKGEKGYLWSSKCA